MGCAASTAQTVKDKAGEAKAKYDASQREKWRAEVLVPGGGEGCRFQPIQHWIKVYEKGGKEEGGDAEDEDEGPSALEKKGRAAARKKAGEKVHATVVRTLDDVLSRLLSDAAARLAGDEPEIAAFVMNAAAAAMSFRFATKREKQMRHIREVAAGQVALTLGAAVDAAAEAAGAAGDADLTDEQVQQVADTITARIEAELLSHASRAEELIRQAPVFNMSASTEVDAGVLALQDFLQGFMQAKVALVLAEINRGMAEVVRRACDKDARARVNAARDAVAKAAAEAASAAAEAVKNGTDAPEAADPAELVAVREQMLDEIETRHAQLDGMVGKYVGDLVKLMVPKEEGEEEEEEEEE